MTRRKKQMILGGVLLALLLTASLCWYFRPRTLESITSLKEERIIGLDCRVMEAGVRESKPFTGSFRLQAEAADTEAYRSVMDVLKDCRYRASLQNLLPWADADAGSESSEDLVAVSIFLLYGEGRRITAACF